jgi:hypothetical protein
MFLLGILSDAVNSKGSTLIYAAASLYWALTFATGSGRHIARGVLVDGVVLGSGWLVILWLRSKRRRQRAGPAPVSAARRFNWRANGLVSLGLGLAITIGIFVVGRVAGTKYMLFLDPLLWPGFVVAAPFGGVHGGERYEIVITAIILGNAVAYGAVCLLILWLRHRRAEKRIAPEPGSSSVTQLHL